MWAPRAYQTKGQPRALSAADVDARAHGASALRLHLLDCTARDCTAIHIVTSRAAQIVRHVDVAIVATRAT
jgi:hypothetical protein